MSGFLVTGGGSPGPQGPIGPQGPRGIGITANPYIQLPAAAWWQQLTSGATSITHTETSTFYQNDLTINFVAGIQTFAQCEFILPADYDSGTMTASFSWISINADGPATVVFGVQMVAFADGNSEDGAFGNAQEVVSSFTAAGIINISAETPAITIYNNPSPGKRCKIAIYRLGSGSDNFIDIASVTAVRLTYTRLVS